MTEDIDPDIDDSTWFRNFYRDHDYPDVEKWVQIAAEKNKFAYVSPDKVSPDDGACWDLWGGTIEMREVEA